MHPSSQQHHTHISDSSEELLYDEFDQYLNLGAQQQPPTFHFGASPTSLSSQQAAIGAAVPLTFDFNFSAMGSDSPIGDFTPTFAETVSGGNEAAASATAATAQAQNGTADAGSFFNAAAGQTPFLSQAGFSAQQQQQLLLVTLISMQQQQMHLTTQMQGMQEELRSLRGLVQQIADHVLPQRQDQNPTVSMQNESSIQHMFGYLADQEQQRTTAGTVASAAVSQQPSAVASPPQNNNNNNSKQTLVSFQRDKDGFVAPGPISSRTPPMSAAAAAAKDESDSESDASSTGGGGGGSTLSSNSQQQSRQFYCPEHDKYFASSSNYHRHMREVHGKKKRRHSSTQPRSSSSAAFYADMDSDDPMSADEISQSLSTVNLSK